MVEHRADRLPAAEVVAAVALLLGHRAGDTGPSARIIALISKASKSLYGTAKAASSGRFPVVGVGDRARLIASVHEVGDASPPMILVLAGGALLEHTLAPCCPRRRAASLAQLVGCCWWGRLIISHAILVVMMLIVLGTEAAPWAEPLRTVSLRTVLLRAQPILLLLLILNDKFW